MTNAANQNQLDMLLDATLDDLADMPEFAVCPAGVHLQEVSSWEEDGTVIYINLKHQETEELADPTATPLPAGTTVNLRLDQANEYGQGDLKKFLKALRPSVGGDTVREILENSKGTQVRNVTTLRPDKKEKTKKYFGIKSTEVV